jgi:acyl carrier protein
MDDVYTRIKIIFNETMGLQETAITHEAHLSKDLGVDSLDFAELIMEFENEFDIRIPHEDAEELQSVKDVESYIKKSMAKPD